MEKSIHHAISLNDNKTERSFKINYPSICPICGKSGTPTHTSSFYIDNIFSCPNLFCTFFCHNCENMFIGNYCYNEFAQTYILTFEPHDTPQTKDFPKHIKEISPTFCDIYNQSLASQQYRLKDISGMGYRKALEFLVKDYAIFLNQKDEEKIKKLSLSQCINEYIDNNRIKKLALASAWIGNDETHYTKKNEEYNTDVLVEFIEAIVSFINSDLSSFIAESLINQKKANKK